MLLIVILALLAPLRCLISAAFLLFIALFLSLVHSLGIMLSRAIDRHEFEWLCLGRVDELMLGTCWYDDDV